MASVGRQSPHRGNQGKLLLDRSPQHYCHTCGKLFTAERLRVHLSKARSSQSGCRSGRFSCPTPGCGKDYADKAGLDRHTRGCHVTKLDEIPIPTYQCRCGKSFQRWDKFLPHYRRVCSRVTRPGSRHFICQCSLPFDSIGSFMLIGNPNTRKLDGLGSLPPNFPAQHWHPWVSRQCEPFAPLPTWVSKPPRPAGLWDRVDRAETKFRREQYYIDHLTDPLEDLLYELRKAVKFLPELSRIQKAVPFTFGGALVSRRAAACSAVVPSNWGLALVCSWDAQTENFGPPGVCEDVGGATKTMMTVLGHEVAVRMPISNRVPLVSVLIGSINTRHKAWRRSG